MKKRISMVLAFMMVMSLFVQVPAGAAGDTPSSWAADEVNQAINTGLVPDALQAQYQSNCTREVFCMLAVKLVEVKTGKSVNDVLQEKGLKIDASAFTDTSSDVILAANALGIVNGVGNGKFSPQGLLTREQAATMLMRASNVLGYTPSGTPMTFADSGSFSAYAVESINFVTAAGVMNGVSSNTFSPQGYYTREMAYLTMLRLYKAMGGTVPSTSTSTSTNTTGGVMSAEEIFKQYSSGVFPITVYDMEKEKIGSGSGFFIESDCTLVTNYHVIADAHSATVKLSTGEEKPIVKVLDYDMEKDIAILKIEGSGYTALPLGDSSAISSGQKVFAIGSPMGLENSISDGIVSNPYREEIGGIQITASISPGSSGGALFNDKGQVIGVTFGGISNGQNLNFAVPINDVKSLARDKSLTLTQLIVKTEHYRYENRPDLLDQIYDETEPNDSYANATFLDNGDSIHGTLSGDDIDAFVVACNVKGKIRVSLASESSGAKSTLLMVCPEGDLKSSTRKIANGIYSEGLYVFATEFNVAQPGYYNIIVANAEELNEEYFLYYEFVPEGVEEKASIPQSEIKQFITNPQIQERFDSFLYMDKRLLK